MRLLRASLLIAGLELVVMFVTHYASHRLRRR